MTMTDPIADMLTRIRNANSAMFDTVKMPGSKLKESLAVILEREGFIAGYRVEPNHEKPGTTLEITLKYSGDRTRTIAGIKAVLRSVDGVSPKDLKSLADDAKTKLGSGVVAFVAAADGKASLVVGVTDDLTARISAVDLVRLGAEALGGKGGGGRPDMAQAGGPDGAKADAALAAIEKAMAGA